MEESKSKLNEILGKEKDEEQKKKLTEKIKKIDDVIAKWKDNKDFDTDLKNLNFEIFEKKAEEKKDGNSKMNFIIGVLLILAVNVVIVVVLFTFFNK